MDRSIERKTHSIGIVLLVYELFSKIGITQIPPVTLLSIILQVGLFLGTFQSYLGEWSVQSLENVCLSAQNVLKDNQFQRIFTAPLFHGSDLHLYYNMVSLAWKGIHLERKCGSLAFLTLLVFMIGLTGLVYVGLCATLAKNLKDPSYLRQCAIGFSGVLFSMKVLCNDISDGNFGIFSVPRNLAIWAELLIIQVLVPNASWIGHLSGIISGVMITYCAPLLFKILLKLPYDAARRCPSGIIVTALLVGLHYEWIEKPWTTKWFWSSGPALVCINRHYVYEKLEFKRLLSGPLEHSSGIHFYICLASLLLKLKVLETKRGVLRTLAIAVVSLLGTGATYVFIMQAIFDEQTCAQGLSGANFALKIFVFASILPRPRGSHSYFPILCFELAEILVLIEKRTFLYHFSGITFAIICHLLYYLIFLRTSKFPGKGHPLLETKSWGYNYSTRRFLRKVKSPSPGHSSRYISLIMILHCCS